MCGPSKTVKDLNDQAQTLNNNINAQASSVFGNDTKIFNDLTNEYNTILRERQGFDQAQLNNMNATVVDQAALQNRNVQAAIRSSEAAIGGGNQPLASGAVGGRGAEAAATIAGQESAGLRQVQEANAALINQNMWKAREGLAAAPNIFNNATAFDKAAEESNQNATQSQMAMDKANSWWKGPVMGAAGAALNFIPGVGPALSTMFQGVTGQGGGANPGIANMMPWNRPPSSSSNPSVGATMNNPYFDESEGTS